MDRYYRCNLANFLTKKVIVSYEENLICSSLFSDHPSYIKSETIIYSIFTHAYFQLQYPDKPKRLDSRDRQRMSFRLCYTKFTQYTTLQLVPTPLTFNRNLFALFILFSLAARLSHSEQSPYKKNDHLT